MKIVKYLLLLAFVSLIGWGITKILFSPFFTIKKVDIKINGDISRNEIMGLWKGFLKQNYSQSACNLFRLNSEALSRFIISDVRIDRVRIKRRPQNKLIILINTRKPFAWIKDSLACDEKGIIFPICGTSSLPHLLGQEEKKGGDVIDVSNLFFLWTKAKSYSFFPKIKEMKEEKGKVFFLLDNIWFCIPSEKGGFTKRFKRLEIILKTDLSNIKLIDLSYDDVILSPSF